MNKQQKHAFDALRKKMDEAGISASQFDDLIKPNTNETKEIDTIKKQLADLFNENARLRLELNKLYKRLDAMHDTIEYIRTRVYP